MPASVSEFNKFKQQLELLVAKNPNLITATMGNIFTMRLLGNKTHGDLAEVGITEFVNQYMKDYKAQHVGKENYRSKKKEEDISVTSKKSRREIPISLKAYGDGPLQLSTDKDNTMFSLLKQKSTKISSKKEIDKVLRSEPFAAAKRLHILLLIHRETIDQNDDDKKANKREPNSEKKYKGTKNYRNEYNIMVFDLRRAFRDVKAIERVNPDNKKRKHPIYRFTARDGSYLFEVRYGGKSANALQRGLWTHTKHAYRYFDSLTKGWIDHSHNHVLRELFSHALVANKDGHVAALKMLKRSVRSIKQNIR